VRGELFNATVKRPESWCGEVYVKSKTKVSDHATDFSDVLQHGLSIPIIADHSCTCVYQLILQLTLEVLILLHCYSLSLVIFLYHVAVI